jgi:hypothetical protein
MAETSYFCDVALSYAARGFEVFPLAPRSKVPLIAARKGGKGLHDATRDPRTIRRWWSSCPDANVAARTGVTFDVVDLDGPQAIEAITAARGDGARLTGPAVRTPSGWHVYVQPTGMGNRAGLLPGVDYRGVGGYICLPPSVHPSGERYQWAGSRGWKLDPLPPWLVRLVERHRDLPVTRPDLPVAPGRATAYGAAALRRELDELGQTVEGARNDSLNRSAFALGQLVASGALAEGPTAEALLGAGLRLGLGERECERTIASGMSAGMEQPRLLER